jgi:hypothetical protein
VPTATLDRAMAAKGGEAQRQASLKRVRENSESVRDIGPIPAVVNTERRAACERDFRLFCETYFPLTFALAWSPDHLKAIAKIQASILEGGLFAFAMPRGSGKTTLCEAGATWALLYGHRRFPVIVGADAASAQQILDSIKAELESNELLQADFPEVCYPIEKLEGIAHRCKGQTCEGERTGIVWSVDEIVFPTVPGSQVGGSVVRVAGITGRIRGLKHKTAEGHSIRPDLVIIDDPQTDESANSLTQCASRERTLAGAVLGLAGPGKKIAGFMPCTVIRPHDMADSILNRDKHPEWNGERTKLLYEFPSRMDLWEQYRDIRGDWLRNDKQGPEPTAFYLDNCEEMDKGARVAWEQRHNPDELTALQHCMNLLFQDEFAFYAEYQNEPKALESLGANELTADQVAEKLSRFPQRAIPLEATRVTAFIDVQGSVLFYCVCAWADDFTGWVVDYGSYPDQRKAYFTVRDVKNTLQAMFPTAGQEGQIYGGLNRLVTLLHSQRWLREDGAEFGIERGLIDANWGESSDVVYKFTRECPVKDVWLASHGRYVGASSLPMSQYKKVPGERQGLNWRIPTVRGKRAARHVLFDTNFWKSFVHSRLAVPIGDRGCLSIFGDRAERHRLFAEHVTSEYRVRTYGRGREVDEWKARPDQTENHWLDCLVGCAVAASERGSVLDESKAALSAPPDLSAGTPQTFTPPPQRRKPSFRELQARARAVR